VQTLNSLLKIEDKRWEAICVDDGSNTDTLQVLEKYTEKHEKIKFIRRTTQPKGAPRCRNLGVKHTSGDFIVFLDSDDLVAPWFVADQLKLVELFPEYDLWVYSMLTFKHHPGDKDILWEKDFLKAKDFLEIILLKDNPWSGSAVLWRKKAFEDFGRWNERLICWQDWELHLRVILSNLSIKEDLKDRPQIFVRRNNVSQITNEDTFTKTLLSRRHLFKHSYQLLQENGKANKKNVLALSGYVYRDALRIIDHQLDTSYKGFYNLLKEFNISRWVYYRGYLFLKWRAFVVKHKLENKLTRYEWYAWVPLAFSAKRLYKVQKVKPEYLRQVKQLNY
jgi:glycosyltransferase involved in cell wall biosynthesis